jgi:hypothetical protein
VLTQQPVCLASSSNSPREVGGELDGSREVGDGLFVPVRRFVCLSPLVPGGRVLGSLVYSRGSRFDSFFTTTEQVERATFLKVAETAGWRVRELGPSLSGRQQRRAR